MKFEITSYPQHLIPIQANSIPQLLFQNLAATTAFCHYDSSNSNRFILLERIHTHIYIYPNIPCKLLVSCLADD